ncbi:RagB/SusD family nutrient uptake outer membrane protein [Chryseosolibacter indicus]|uniref:RagB/SusD family nutrient uptake outer membrane protein n=1 Tax=Chryseosolibacter indicus TaxID=2782351 RepID=A0ABS5VW80_9BACT|nr:RagB/SusD family nutrient uptake outer membrane protein [Chryseosolibacter indicus]MBT1705690.1 RagB/SusD family nutrient uptake outer membrane protein [Chryseosolibacter indicus]
MKISSLKNITLLTLVVVGFSACDKYLEENPDNRVELNNLDKAAQLLTNAYASGSYTFTEWMSDNVSYTFGTTKLPEHDQAYTWSDFTGIDQDTPANFWNTTYDAIAHTNEVLAVIDKLPGDEDRKNAIKGEALLARAYGHFMLVNLFAKHYDANTADNDPGVPYVTEPETQFIKKYTRNTVEEVYDKIEDDLLEGLELVKDSYYSNSGKYHFTRNAALAFASRFYLFKGEFNDCIDYSNELLGANPSLFIKDIPALLQQRVNVEDYIRLYHSPTDDSNLLLIRQVSNFHLPNLGHWPTRDLYSEIFRSNPYRLTDEREDPAWLAGENGLAATKFEFLFERSSLTSNVGLNYTIFLGFRGEEVLLNRAECYILRSRSLNANDLNLALADLQLLANKRYRATATNQPTLTIQALRTYFGTNSNDRLICLLYLLDERTKEFMHEGLRWFDIKRYGLPVQHVLPDGSISNLDEDDDRKVLQIPQAAIDVGGLEPNSR